MSRLLPPDYAFDPDAHGSDEQPAAAGLHGSSCTPVCNDRAVPSPLVRSRPPAQACPWCGAPPLVECTRMILRGRRLRLANDSRVHPSRLEAIA